MTTRLIASQGSLCLASEELRPGPSSNLTPAVVPGDDDLPLCGCSGVLLCQDGTGHPPHWSAVFFVQVTSTPSAAAERMKSAATAAGISRVCCGAVRE